MPNPDQYQNIDQAFLKELLEISAKVADIDKCQRKQGRTQDGIRADLRQSMVELKELKDNTITSSVISNEQHVRHHVLFDQLLKEQEARTQFWQEVASKVASGGVWAALAGIGTVILYAVTHYFKMKGG